jgi:uncharacterized protein involved in exopolysaccharide biosynthesis
MDKESLKATLTELEQELRDLDPAHEQSRQMLQDAVRDIRAALHDEGSELPDQTLIQRLTVATEKFEGSHPALTNVLTRLVDGLGQMGI